MSDRNSRSNRSSSFQLFAWFVVMVGLFILGVGSAGVLVTGGKSSTFSTAAYSGLGIAVAGVALVIGDVVIVGRKRSNGH